jgi:SAM-dependent methyltransferase
MPLAYYSVAAEREFWTEHWAETSVEELLAVARTSPLTALITAALPADGPILEAGCGLGQYVILLRERGWPTVGADWSVAALASCGRAARVPLVAMDLRTLAFPDDSFAAYLSLGVMEHDPAGPDAFLAEARRVLRPGGVAVVSVPYVNGVRCLAAPLIETRGRVVARRGGKFYQYAFRRGELVAALARHGFVVRGLHPYDPARLLRNLLPGLARRAVRGGVSGPGGAGQHRGIRGLVRRLLYREPALRMFAHMLLAVAVKP